MANNGLSNYSDEISQIYEYTHNGETIKYKVYMPENYDANTQVAVYFHGGGGGDKDFHTPTTLLSSDVSSNSIIIMPDASTSYMETANFANDVVDIQQSVKDTLGITSEYLAVGGFSNGSTPAYRTMGEYIKRNPDAPPQTLFLVDNYTPVGTGSVTYLPQLINGNKDNYGEYFKNNDTLVVSLYPKNENLNPALDHHRELYALHESGVKCINLYSDMAKNPSKYGATADVANYGLSGSVLYPHHYCEYVFFKEGLFDLTSGDVILDPDEYSIRVSDFTKEGAITKRGWGGIADGGPEQFKSEYGRLFNIVDTEDFDSIEKIREYFGIDDSLVYKVKNVRGFADIVDLKGDDDVVASDYNLVLENINKYLATIKATGFMDGNFKLPAGGASTTQVPSKIPSVLAAYFNSSYKLVLQYSQFLYNIEAIARMIKDEVDLALVDVAEVLQQHMKKVMELFDLKDFEEKDKEEEKETEKDKDKDKEEKTEKDKDKDKSKGGGGPTITPKPETPTEETPKNDTPSKEEPVKPQVLSEETSNSPSADKLVYNNNDVKEENIDIIEEIEDDYLEDDYLEDDFYDFNNQNNVSVDDDISSSVETQVTDEGYTVSNKKGSNFGKVAGIVGAVGVAGAAAYAGTNYIKKKKEEEDDI